MTWLNWYFLFPINFTASLAVYVLILGTCCYACCNVLTPSITLHAVLPVKVQRRCSGDVPESDISVENVADDDKA